jgi:NADH:ubiquinone oxidoreductase subunit H
LRAGALQALQAASPAWTALTASPARAAAVALVALLATGCAPDRPTSADRARLHSHRRAEPTDTSIRDVRPTKLQRGERMLVEAEAPIFRVGAFTRVILDDLRDTAGHALSLPARAVSEDRVVADVDDTVEAAVARQHTRGLSTVTVSQSINGEAQRWTSDARAPYDVDLFPPSLQHLANGLSARLPGPAWLWWLVALAAAAAVVAGPLPVIAGLVVVWERKISGYMGSRLGPNRVGPGGWLQWLADGLKLLMKEDIVPREADPRLFRAAPYLAFIGLFLTFVVLPFSRLLVVSDLDVGLLFLLSVTSLVVVSIIMGGWSSNSKWSLLGGMRSAAQIISYELPASVALLTIATLTGSLSTQRIVETQGGWPWQWNLFRDPFTFVAFFIWFISALAEGNRTPFDLPEAESELVSGYNTEYSGFRFSLFPLVEWVNVAVIGAVGTMLFLGGWRLPFVTEALIDRHRALDLLGFATFLFKDVAIVFVIIWIRWTLPRFRVDQMMNLCWKYFIPFAFVCFLGELGWTWLASSLLQQLLPVLMFAVLGLGGGGWFIGRVRSNARRYTDLVLNDALGKGNR